MTSATHIPNQEQAQYWNGPAAQRWTDHQDVLDRALLPFGRAAMQRLAVESGERVLDVGCGCGQTSLELAARVGPLGHVSGIDLSRSMLERARTRAALSSNVRFFEADAAEFRAEPAFDAIFSRFGVMFFDDPVATFSHLREQLTTAGRLGFVCWRALDDNPWAALPLQWVRSARPDAPQGPAPSGPGPFSMGDAELVRAQLERAGFRGIAIELFDSDVTLSTGELAPAVEFAMSAGPAARLLVGASELELTRARAAVTAGLEPYWSDRGVALGGSGWVVSARAG
jgi:SAM-dependent methyltransferase